MKPTVDKVLPLVKEYYALPGNAVGGCFHIVLDDGNVDDCHVQNCLDLAMESNDEKGIELGKLLLQMSKTQRLKLYKRS